MPRSARVTGIMSRIKMATTRKLGRPANDEPKRDDLTTVVFKVDGETLAALKLLEAAAGPNIRGRRSAVLRELILGAIRK